MMGMRRTWLKPGAFVGTRIMEARACGGASGSVTAMTMAKAAPSAAVVNHFRPSTTHSPSSSTAVVSSHVGLEPARSGSVIEKQLRIFPAARGRRNSSF